MLVVLVEVAVVVVVTVMTVRVVVVAVVVVDSRSAQHRTRALPGVLVGNTLPQPSVAVPFVVDSVA